jgi:hypothetical protein
MTRVISLPEPGVTLRDVRSNGDGCALNLRLHAEALILWQLPRKRVAGGREFSCLLPDNQVTMALNAGVAASVLACRHDQPWSEPVTGPSSFQRTS